MSKKSKLARFLKAVTTAQDILVLLNSVVDIDRLIDVANDKKIDNKSIKLSLDKTLDDLVDDPSTRA